jgi:hypothetical protein
MRNPLVLLVSSILLAISITMIANLDRGRVTSRSAKINTGQKTEIADKTISASGGEIIINDTGNPLNGLTVDVPANAYAEDRRFTISYSAITSFDCGPYFHPVTPLITISNGGGYSATPMTINIPVVVPPGQFAMAFLYNHKTGELEGMPFSESDENHIKVVTTNFSNTQPNELAGLGAQVNAATDVPLSSIVVSTIDTPALMKDYVTPFKPGTDDWQFVNWGSYIAPGGHCSGQVMGLLWYYHNKKLKGNPSLHGRFDNDGINKTPGLWQDDVAGYKFCSMLQLDWTYDGNKLITAWQNNDTRTMWAFAYAMRVTDQPQLCIIGTWKDDSRHAILVYGMKAGKLLVNDPNKPGSENPHIFYDPNNGTFTPYFTGLKAGDPGMQWPRILYYAKTMVGSWKTATTHWQEIANKTIGDDKFPPYTIVALNEQDEFVPLTDGFTVPLGGTLTIRVRCPGVETDYAVFNSSGFPFTRDGDVVTLPEADEQLIGICVTDTAKSKHWIGFKWFKVRVASTLPVADEKASGKIKLQLRIDGVNAQIDSATFSIDPDGFTLEGWGPRFPEGAYAWPHMVKIHARSWHGIGNYDLDDGGPGSYFWQYHSYYPDPKDPGKLSIHTWRNGNLEGRFYFDVIDGSGKKKYVDGEFRR